MLRTTETASRAFVFEQLPVRQAVLKQVIPSVISQMIALVYSLADTYFVGMLNDARQTAAVTVVFSSFVMLTAISNLFGVGGGGALSGLLGQKRPEEARQTASVSFWCGLAAAVGFSLLFLAAEPLVLPLCGATAETYALALDYAWWAVVIGGPATIINTLLANLVRAEGAARAASFGVALGGVLNLVLDPLFILPQFLDLGAAGAGMATALANGAALVYFLIYVLHPRPGGVVNIRPVYLRFIRQRLGRIVAVGLSSALQYALTVVAVSALTNFVSHYNTAAVAALGIVKKLDQLPLYFAIGVANGLLPLLAYTHAAGHYRRRHQAFVFGTVLALGFAVICLILYELWAPQLAGLFIGDRQTVEYAAGFLRRMVVAMPLMAVCYPLIIQFQAMRRVRESLICSVLRKGVLDIPLLFLLNSLLPLYGCMWVQPLVDATSLVVALLLYRRIKREELLI